MSNVRAVRLYWVDMPEGVEDLDMDPVIVTNSDNVLYNLGDETCSLNNGVLASYSGNTLSLWLSFSPKSFYETRLFEVGEIVFKHVIKDIRERQMGDSRRVVSRVVESSEEDYLNLVSDYRSFCSERKVKFSGLLKPLESKVAELERSLKVAKKERDEFKRNYKYPQIGDFYLVLGELLHQSWL